MVGTRLPGVWAAGARVSSGLPTGCPCGRADQLVLVIQQHVEIGHVPGDRRRGPGALDARSDRVVAHAALVARDPAQTLLRDVAALWADTDLGGVACAVGLAEGVAAGGQGRRLHVIHPHPFKGNADIARRLHRLGYAAGALRVDVDQAHLDRGQGLFQHHVLVGLNAGLVTLLTDPFLLGAPVDVLLGLPHVGAAAAEAKYRPAHRLDRDIAGQDEQIGPRQAGAVFLLDRPQEAARLVQVAVVRPGVQWGEPLLARACAAATVAGAIGAGRVPRHADEEGTVVAVVRRPPRLAVRHQGGQVALHRREIERLERLGVIEGVAHRITGPSLLVQDVHRQMIGPPVAIGPTEKRPQRRLFFLRVAERARAIFAVHHGVSLDDCWREVGRVSYGREIDKS